MVYHGVDSPCLRWDLAFEPSPPRNLPQVLHPGPSLRIRRTAITSTDQRSIHQGNGQDNYLHNLQLPLDFIIIRKLSHLLSISLHLFTFRIPLPQ